MQILSTHSIRFLVLIMLGCIGSVLAVDAPDVHWVPTVGIVAVPKNATLPHRESAKRLASAFGGSVVSVDGSNPVCCVWLEIRLPVPTPGKPGYIILHQKGGSVITASDQAQLDAAVARMITISKIERGVRVLPEGIITSFPTVTL